MNSGLYRSHGHYGPSSATVNDPATAHGPAMMYNSDVNMTCEIPNQLGNDQLQPWPLDSGVNQKLDKLLKLMKSRKTRLQR